VPSPPEEKPVKPTVDRGCWSGNGGALLRWVACRRDAYGTLTVVVARAGADHFERRISRGDAERGDGMGCRQSLTG